jgi:SAM-dependent methyltransferase
MSRIKDVVEAGYDAIADRYGTWGGWLTPLRLDYVTMLTSRLRPGSPVLEIGCGNGVPVARHLARRHEVTAVDISLAQVQRARRNVPTARILHADVMRSDFPAGSFGAVICLYTLMHIPRSEQNTLLRRVRTWMRTGGGLLFNVPVGDEPGATRPDPGLFGVTMYHSYFDEEAIGALLPRAGFRVVREDVRTQVEWDDQLVMRQVPYLWIMAVAS